MGAGTGTYIYQNTSDTQARKGAPTFKHWDNVEQGGDESSERGECWSLRLVERIEKNQVRGMDTRRAEIFTAIWIDMERWD